MEKLLEPLPVPEVVAQVPALLALALLLCMVIKRLMELRRHLAAALSPLKRCCSRAGSDVKLWALARRRLLQQKLGSVRLLLLLLSVALAPFSFATFMGKRLSPFNPTEGQRVVVALQHLFVVALNLFPGLVTARTMDGFCACLIVVGALKMAPVFNSPESHNQAHAEAIFLWGAVCVARRTSGSPWCYLSGLANLLAAWVNVLATGGQSSGMAGEGGNGGIFEKLITANGGQFSGFREFALAHLVLLGVVHLLERVAESRLVAEMRGEDAEQLFQAASALLRGCCDVVVELDNRGAVLGRAEDLGSYLLRGSALLGMPLTDLVVHEEERQQLQERLFAPPVAEQSVAESMPISVRDGCNNLLRVELLWFSFYRFDQELAFMAGFREFAEAQHAEQGAALPEGSLTTAAAPKPRSGTSLSEEVSYSSQSSGSSLDVPFAVLDATFVHLPLHEMSSSFCMRIGRLPRDTSFTKHLNKPEEFASWLGRAIQAAAHGKDPGAIKVIFKMPQGKVEACCNLDREETTNLRKVRLNFTRIRLRREREPARRGSRFLGTPGHSHRPLVAL